MARGGARQGGGASVAGGSGIGAGSDRGAHVRGGLVLGLAHCLLHSLEFVREKSAPRDSGCGGGSSGGATQGNCEGGGEVAVGKLVSGEEMDAGGGGGDIDGEGAGAVGGGAGMRGSDWVGGGLAIDGRGLRVLMAALSCASALATLSPHLHLRSSSAPELRRSAASAGGEVGGEGGGGTGRESSGGGQAGVVQAVAGGGGVEAVVGGRGSSGGRQEDVVGARVGDGRGPAVLLMWAWSVLLTQGCLGGAILRERTLRRLVEINHGRAGDYLPTHVASRLFALAVPACKALISLIMDAKAREVQMQLVEAAVARVHDHVALLAGEAREAANLLETHQLSFPLWSTEAATKLRVTSGVAAATVLKALLPLLPRLCPPPPPTTTTTDTAAAAAPARTSWALLVSMMGAAQLLACQGALTRPGSRASSRQEGSSAEVCACA